MNTLTPTNTFIDGGQSLHIHKLGAEYVDYANEMEGTLPARTSNRCNSLQAFPSKLHFMIQEVEKDGSDGVISWLVHGRSFLVSDHQRFVKEILPFWFQMNHYSSFQRQLNMYGFKRITAGNDKGSYYHPLFLRGKEFLVSRIERVKIKGTGGRKPSSPDTEPNFYALPMLPASDAALVTPKTLIEPRVAVVTPTRKSSKTTKSRKSRSTSFGSDFALPESVMSIDFEAHLAVKIRGQGWQPEGKKTSNKETIFGADLHGYSFFTSRPFTNRPCESYWADGASNVRRGSPKQLIGESRKTILSRMNLENSMLASDHLLVGQIAKLLAAAQVDLEVYRQAHTGAKFMERASMLPPSKMPSPKPSHQTITAKPSHSLPFIGKVDSATLNLALPPPPSFHQRDEKVVCPVTLRDMLFAGYVGQGSGNHQASCYKSRSDKNNYSASLAALLAADTLLQENDAVMAEQLSNREVKGMNSSHSLKTLVVAGDGLQDCNVAAPSPPRTDTEASGPPPSLSAFLASLKRFREKGSAELAIRSDTLPAAGATHNDKEMAQATQHVIRTNERVHSPRSLALLLAADKVIRKPGDGIIG
ncbi:sequence-specific DNA binding [Mayamaea pseudoterrestris]|nr:sequence-specific DNA binding [Mayamaea pseudoterrestris]